MEYRMKSNGYDGRNAISIAASGDCRAVADPIAPTRHRRHETENGDRPSEREPVPAHDEELAQITRRQLELIGEDPLREGLLQTPTRVAKAISWLTRGYGEDVRAAVGDAIFDEDHGGMVLVRDIEVYSLCEHHMLPFFGKAHVAYIPDGRIIGLSKLPRIVDVFARRLQVQERLVAQVASAIDELLRPKGVAVMIEAAHLCMMMRGVEKQRAMTVTSALRGIFLSDGEARAEFHRLTCRPSHAW